MKINFKFGVTIFETNIRRKTSIFKKVASERDTYTEFIKYIMLFRGGVVLSVKYNGIKFVHILFKS